jgi:hypothetical protein
LFPRAVAAAAQPGCRVHGSRLAFSKLARTNKNGSMMEA